MLYEFMLAVPFVNVVLPLNVCSTPLRNIFIAPEETLIAICAQVFNATLDPVQYFEAPSYQKNVIKFELFNPKLQLFVLEVGVMFPITIPFVGPGAAAVINTQASIVNVEVVVIVD